MEGMKVCRRLCSCNYHGILRSHIVGQQKFHPQNSNASSITVRHFAKRSKNGIHKRKKKGGSTSKTKKDTSIRWTNIIEKSVSIVRSNTQKQQQRQLQPQQLLNQNHNLSKIPNQRPDFKGEQGGKTSVISKSVSVSVPRRRKPKQNRAPAAATCILKHEQGGNSEVTGYVPRVLKVQQQQQQQQQPLVNNLDNGEQTNVSDDDSSMNKTSRRKFKAILKEYKNSDVMEPLEMSSDLTKAQRSLLHKLAYQMGLSAKSHGSNAKRRILISKPEAEGAEGEEKGHMDYPKLDIGELGNRALEKYIKYYPPTDADIRSIEDIHVNTQIREDDENISLQTRVMNFGNRLMEPFGFSSHKATTHSDEITKPNVPHFVDKTVVPVPRREVDLQQRGELYKRSQQSKKRHFNYQKMEKMRSKLPAYQHQDRISEIIRSNRVTIVIGETGCGKSTQIPQFILDSAEGASCKIAITQPRRISATSLARRVASERCERVGRSVGYSVRMDTSASNATQLLFLTPGVLLKRLHNDPDLLDFSHIIIDEIHEKDKIGSFIEKLRFKQHTEFLMIILKDLMKKRKDLHVVLMSATLQSAELTKYWSSVGSKHDGEICEPAKISIPGRTFPVNSFYLEDILRITGANETKDMSENDRTSEELVNQYHMIHNNEKVDNDLIVEIMKYITNSCYGNGAILVFLPGWPEISTLMKRLHNDPFFNDDGNFSLLPLHSGIPSEEQNLVFDRPRKGVRKIILSTNIAETSVTIGDVAFVIDTGRAKEKSYDPHLRTNTFQSVWVSQASAKQRRGRAGRTMAGTCFHLFSRRQHESFRQHTDSELLRTSLEEICLQCKRLGVAPGQLKDPDGIPAFLGSALNPPHHKSISNALEALAELGAMDSETNLSHLGFCLSNLSIEPRLGKMIIWGYVLGCSEDAIAMAVGMSSKSPFVLAPPSERGKAIESKIDISQGTRSDHVTVLKVLEKVDELRERDLDHNFFSYCGANYINISTIEMISDLRKNIARELSTIGMDFPNQKGWHNRNDGFGKLAFLESAIAAGSFPNVATREKSDKHFRTSMNQMCTIHPSSINKQQGDKKCKVQEEIITYGEMMVKDEEEQYTIGQTSYLSSALPLILLCGDISIHVASSIANEEVQEGETDALMSVNGWISVQCESRTAAALALLRKRLDSIFDNIVSDPQNGFNKLSQMDKNTLQVVDAIVKSSHRTSTS